MSTGDRGSLSAVGAARVRAAGTRGARRRVVIVGAAGRDFHKFNVVFRRSYPEGIPIEAICRDRGVDEVALYVRYRHRGRVLPAVGYGDAQLEALADTIRRADADVVVSGRPFDLAGRLRIDKPVVRARYELADAGDPTLGSVLDAFLARLPALKRVS